MSLRHGSVPALLGGVALLVVLIFVTFQYVADDAFISFRYARNLAGGAGLVFNPGERVEGFSNPTWTLLLAAAIGLGANPVWVAQILGIAATLFIGLFIAKLRAVLRTDASAPAHWVGILLFATHMSVLFYAASGMETAFFSLLLMVGLYRFFQEQGALTAGTTPAIPWSALCFSAAALTRPEGIAFVAAPGLLLLWRARAARGRTYLLRFVLWYVLPVAAWFVWRLSYYGLPLPHTYYAKVPTQDAPWRLGLEYTKVFLGSGGGWVLVLLALGSLFFRRGWQELVLLGMVAVNAAFVLAVGGDEWMPYSRLYYPAVPILIVLSQLALEGLRDRLGRYSPALAVLALAVGTAVAVAVTLRSGHGTGVSAVHCLRQLVTEPARAMDNQIAKWRTPLFREIGDWFERNGPEVATLALTEAGAVPYYLPRYRIVDLTGLTDRQIAPARRKLHEVVDYIFSRSPDYYLLYQDNYVPDTNRPAITQEQRFRERYTVEHVFEYQTAKLSGEPTGLERWVLFRRLEQTRPVPGSSVGEEIRSIMNVPGRVTTRWFHP